jgi:hypothetical protein
MIVMLRCVLLGVRRGMLGGLGRGMLCRLGRGMLGGLRRGVWLIFYARRFIARCLVALNRALLRHLVVLDGNVALRGRCATLHGRVLLHGAAVLD